MTTARTIKRYANRKLYDTRDSRYVTLDHIAAMVRAGDDVRVVENTTRADLTTATLAQIIFEEEKKTPRLSVAGLRKIIQGGMPGAGAPPADGAVGGDASRPAPERLVRLVGWLRRARPARRAPAESAAPARLTRRGPGSSGRRSAPPEAPRRARRSKSRIRRRASRSPACRSGLRRPAVLWNRGCCRPGRRRLCAVRNSTASFSLKPPNQRWRVMMSCSGNVKFAQKSFAVPT